MLTDEPFKSVTLHGRIAGWIEGYGLIWERTGISFLLISGSKLSLKEATRIAESLQMDDKEQ